MLDRDIILELYPELTPREAFFAAEQAGLISKTLRDFYLLDFPIQQFRQITTPVRGKEKWTIRECREVYDHFANKSWGEMESSEIDAALDFYDPSMKEQAEAYLRMRGGYKPLDDGD